MTRRTFRKGGYVGTKKTGTFEVNLGKRRGKSKGRVQMLPPKRAAGRTGEGRKP